MANAAPNKWRTVPYIEPNGVSDVLNYLEKLQANNPKHRLHFDHIVEQFALRGPFAVGYPYWKAQDGGFFAIRWGGRFGHRIYCCVEGERQIVMLVAVRKLWPTFRKEDQRKCEERRTDFLTAAYDQEQRGLKYLANRQRRGKNGSA